MSGVGGICIADQRALVASLIPSFFKDPLFFHSSKALKTDITNAFTDPFSVLYRLLEIY